MFRLRFDQSKVWEWNRAAAVAALAFALVAGCAKPRPRAEIPDPVGHANEFVASDGERLVFVKLVGGPSGAIDASRLGEIELVAAAAARYLATPISYAKDVQPGQLVTYGPATDGQAIEASGMTAKIVGIERGVLIEGKVDPPAPVPVPPESIKISLSAYYPAGNVNQSTVWPGHGFALPSKGYASLLSTGAPDGTRGGYLSFPAGAETAAVFRWQLAAGWDRSAVALDLAWWSGGAASTGADAVSLALDYACSRHGMSAGAIDPAWIEAAAIPLTAGAANTLFAATFSHALGECEPGDYVRFRMRRGGAGDTFKAAFNLDGLTVRWMQEAK